jgi:hypothetical protein
MAGGDGIFCAGCGITLRSFMKVCPRCGLERENAEPIEIPHSLAESPPESPARIGGGAAPQGALDLPSGVIFLSPGEMSRRFPVFTSAQRALLAIGIGLLIMMLAIAYLLWRQQKRDLFRPPANQNVVTNPSPTNSAGAPNTPPGPDPVDDQKVAEGVKTALSAYNPLGFERYKIDVNQGIVTLAGEAFHQPEKDGADNVVRLVAGVKSVVNNLKVKPDEPLFPPKVNAAEANLLDEALRRQIQADEQARLKHVQPDQRSEAERQKRELERKHEEEIRKAAEEKLRREIEEYEKRQEELRRVEAERRARAEQARFEISTLRTGTVAWSAMVDGVDEIIFSGSSSSVRHLSGKPPRDVRASFSAPMPRSPVNLDLISTGGRGSIVIVQQPSPANGYTAIVRIDDSGRGSDNRYVFTLRWTLP